MSRKLKKPLIALLVASIVGFELDDLLGQGTKVQLGKDTTFITAPLADDGLPNYALAIVQKQKEGITPANNGAILFWQAVASSDLTSQEYQAICRELGISAKSPSSYLVEVLSDENVKRLARWIVEDDKQSTQLQAWSLDAESLDARGIATQIARLALARPWTAAELPTMATWVLENKTSLDLLVEAAAKPRFFSPPPNLLTDPNGSVMELNLAHAGHARRAARSLAARANNRTGNGKFTDAWQDCLAIWRLGSQIAQGRTAVEQLVGISIHAYAMDCTLALLQAEGLPLSVAQTILKDLASLPHQLKFGVTFDFAERLLFLDFSLRHNTGRLGGISQSARKSLGAVPNVAAPDPNVPLRLGNQWFDRLATAASVDDAIERRNSILSIKRERDKFVSQLLIDIEKSKKTRVAEAMTKEQVSELIGRAELAICFSEFDSLNDARDRDETSWLLTETAAALAVHRCQNGTYPQALSELVPSILPEEPLDLYSGQPLMYQRRDNGYLLYSSYWSGRDDNGTDLQKPILNGEWISPNNHEAPAPVGGDLVVRLPLPPMFPIALEELSSRPDTSQGDAKEAPRK